MFHSTVAKKDILLFKKVNTIGVLLESLCRSQQQTNNNYTDQRPTDLISFLNRDEDLNLFPARSQHEVNEIEKKMKRSTFYNKVV